jgi:hypothetical protein
VFSGSGKAPPGSKFSGAGTSPGTGAPSDGKELAGTGASADGKARSGAGAFAGTDPLPGSDTGMFACVEMFSGTGALSGAGVFPCTEVFSSMFYDSNLKMTGTRTQLCTGAWPRRAGMN